MASNLNSTQAKVMATEQFTQIVEAIHTGKYSWACVLFLQLADYNPQLYIPYRTYNRLIKENTCFLGDQPSQDDSDRTLPGLTA